MTIHQKIIFLNLIISLALFEAIFKYLLITGLENIAFVIIFTGFIFSFLIKEYKFKNYRKRAFINSITFSLLFILVFIFDILITDNRLSYKPDIFIILFTFFWLAHFAGSLIGTVPLGVYERLRKENGKSLVDRCLQG